MQPTYMQMAAVLEPFVDIFLCETLASTAETMAAASAASMSGLTPSIAFAQQHQILGCSVMQVLKIACEKPQPVAQPMQH